MRGRGPGSGEGGGWWSLTCLIATLMLCSPCHPGGAWRNVLRHRQGRGVAVGLSGSAGEQGSAFCDARNSNNILIGKRAEGLWLRARAEPSWAPRGCLQAPQPAAEPLLGPPGFFSGKRLVAGWRERGCSISPVPQETHVSPGVRGTSIVPSSSDLPCARTRGLSVDALLLPAPAGSQFSPSPPPRPRIQWLLGSVLPQDVPLGLLETVVVGAPSLLLLRAPSGPDPAASAGFSRFMARGGGLRADGRWGGPGGSRLLSPFALLHF